MSWRSSFCCGFLSAVLIFGASLAGAAEIEVRGTILRPSGEPWPGVRIHLMADSSRYDQAQAALRGEIHPAPLATEAADSRGRYRLVVPQAGIFRLLVEADGCFPLSAGPLALLETTELGPVVPPAASAARVRLLDAAGRPVAGAWVTVRGPAERRFSRELPKAWTLAPRTTRTGVDGWASLPKLPGEQLSVLAFQAGASEARTEGTDTEMILRLGPGAPLEVAAVGAEGRPLPGVLVQVGEGAWTAATTGVEGRASLAAAPDRPTKVRLLAPDGRRLSAEWIPAATGLMSQTLALPPLRALAGMVRAAEGAGPPAGALVWSPDEPGLWTVADRNGQYRLAVPGAVRSLRVDAAGFLSRQSRLAEADLGRGRAPTLALRRSAALPGQALDESGAGLEGIAVAALPPGASGLSPAAVVAWSVSDRAGRFELRGLTPGTPYRFQGVKAGLLGAPQTVITPLPGSSPPSLRLVLVPSQGVRGRLLDPGGQPVREAEVFFRPTAPPKRSDLQPIDPLRPEEEPARAWTDARGVFAVRDLPALQVDLIARKPGFVPSVVRGLQIRPGKLPQPLGDIVLRPGVRLAGRVVDRAGRPIRGAAVHAVQQIDDLDRQEARLRERPPAAVSAGDGGFVLQDLAPGEPLNFLVAAQGFAPAGLRGVRAPVEQPVVVRLEPVANVRGRVLNEEGTAISGAKISLEWQRTLPENPRIQLGEPVLRTAIADRDGRFEMRGVPAGAAEVTVAADGFVTADNLALPVPQEPDNDWTVTLQRGASLEGRISTRRGDPIGGARIVIAGAMALSDDDGRYVVLGVPLGEAEVEVQHPDYPRRIQALTIESGANLFDVQFEAGHRVRGVVLSASREPIAGASVSLETIDQGRERRAYHAATGVSGRFELSAVADGDYQIEAIAEGFAEERSREVITIREDDRNDLEVILDRGASITGRVLGLPRDELAWVEVAAEGEDPDAEIPAVRVDADGRFALRHLPLGNWQVRARHLRRQRSVEARTVLRADGEEAVRDLRFGGGLSLAGKVIFADEPLPGALVSLRAQNRSIERSALTDYRGEFQLNDLEADRYHLGVADRKTLALHNEEIVLENDEQIEIHVRAATVAGSLVDSSSRAPVAGALLVLRPLTGADFMIAGTSEPDGGFLLARVPEGRYRLTASASGYTPAQQEVDVTGADVAGLEVKLTATQGLDLVVRAASGQPPPLVHLRATGATGGSLAETRPVGADGHVRLATLPAGVWDLWIAAPGSAPLQSQVQAPGEPVSLALPPGGRLSVQVPELAESSLIATVAVMGESQQPFSTLTFGGETSSSWPLKAGTAVVEGLPAGAWTVVVQAPDGRIWTKAVVTTGSDGAITLE